MLKTIPSFRFMRYQVTEAVDTFAPNRKTFLKLSFIPQPVLDHSISILGMS
jgi:hypothetical protein